MPKRVNTEAQYRVGDGPVYLSLLVGEAQFGVHDIYLKNRKLLRAGGNLAIELGKGPNLVGQDLRVATLATDINSQTNRLTVTYVLSGGEGAPVTASEMVKSDYGSLLFNTVISFHAIEE